MVWWQLGLCWQGDHVAAVDLQAETSRDLLAESPISPTMCLAEEAEAQVNVGGLLSHIKRERLGPRGTGGDTGEGSRHNVLKEMSWELAGGGTLRAGQWLWGFQVVSSGGGCHDDII